MAESQTAGGLRKPSPHPTSARAPAELSTGRAGHFRRATDAPWMGADTPLRVRVRVAGTPVSGSRCPRWPPPPCGSLGASACARAHQPRARRGQAARPAGRFSDTSYFILILIIILILIPILCYPLLVLHYPLLSNPIKSNPTLPNPSLA